MIIYLLIPFILIYCFFLKKRINNEKERELFKNGFLKISKVDKKSIININKEFISKLLISQTHQ